jgi:hypothetical protein
MIIFKILANLRIILRFLANFIKYSFLHHRALIVLEIHHDGARIAISFGAATSIHNAPLGPQGHLPEQECTIDNEAGAIYDLSGRKVANGQLKKGLYIKNGKKVVVK